MTIPRLIFGYLSQSTDPINISVPWTISDQDGAFKMNYSLEEAVSDNVRVWAKTSWGERPMRFRFGLDARRHLFNPIPILKENLINNTFEQIPTYFPFLEIDKVEILTWEDNPDLHENEIIYILEAHFSDDKEKKLRISEQVGL